MPLPDDLWERIWEWYSRQTFRFAQEINATTRQAIEDAINEFAGQPMTMGQLRERLAETFGEARAQRIAVTEVTRAYAQGTKIAADALREKGWELHDIWHTNRDSLVCEICGPMDGRDVTGTGDYPPAHPNCRCWITTEVM